MHNLEAKNHDKEHEYLYCKNYLGTAINVLHLFTIQNFKFKLNKTLFFTFWNQILDCLYTLVHGH